MSSTSRAPRPPGDEALQKTVLDALRRLVRSFRVGSNDGGPSPAQRFVLERLAERPGASIGELARLTHTDQSSVSVVVSRLVEAGLVERKRSDEDARRAELSLTARGRTFARKSVPSGQAQLLSALASLPAARRTALARELEHLIEAMGIRDEPAGMFFEKVSARTTSPATAGRRSGKASAASPPAPAATASSSAGSRSAGPGAAGFRADGGRAGRSRAAGRPTSGARRTTPSPKTEPRRR